jgi:NTP pyrophosphatase (non-canonical NTP hydrolase)
MTATPKIDPASSLADAIRRVLDELGAMVGEVNVANGWDTSRTGETDATNRVAELALVASEAFEAIEEVRDGHEMTETYYSFKPVPPSLAVEFNSGAAAREYWEATQTPKPEGVPSELADVIIRVLDIADAYGLNIGDAVIEKLNHNATRGLHHGGKAI